MHPTQPPHPTDLMQQQRLLCLRSAELRGTLAVQAEVLRRPLAWCDQLHASVRWLVAHPAWPLGVLTLATVLLVRRPSRLLRWAPRLWWGWTLVRRMQIQMKISR